MSGEGGGGFDIFNPLHLLGLIVVLFIIWLVTGGRKNPGVSDKFITTQDGQVFQTYDKPLPPDADEKQFYKGYFE